MTAAEAWAKAWGAIEAFGMGVITGTLGLAISLVVGMLLGPAIRRSRPACTGVSASWCPVHGDCTCPRDGGDFDYMNDWGCPLHAPSSDHAEAAS